MNIFFLDPSPKKAVEYHNDAHVLKMGIEAAQLMSTAWHVLDADEIRYIETVPYIGARHIYKKTHVNHPMAIWVRTNESNYTWAWRYGDALMKEYTLRWGGDSKIAHLTSFVIDTLSDLPPSIPEGDFTSPPLCMPDEFKLEGHVESYRNYYKQAKLQHSILDRYTKRERPSWSL